MWIGETVVLFMPKGIRFTLSHLSLSCAMLATQLSHNSKSCDCVA